MLAEPGQDPKPEAMELAKVTQGWLESARMPATVGVTIAREGNSHAAKWKGMNPEDRKATAAQSKAQLERLWGPKYEENMVATRQLLLELSDMHPELQDFFGANGLAHSPMLLNPLHNHARRLEKRAEKVSS